MKKILAILILFTIALTLHAQAPALVRGVTPTQVSNIVNAAQVWTNAGGDVKLKSFTTHDTIFIGSNAPLAHPPPFNATRLGVFVHDQAIGETADAHLHLESYDNLIEYGNGNDLVSASIDAEVNSSSNSPFAGLQIFFSDYHGNGEYWDFFADGDVYSQFLFTSLIGSPKDNTPLVMAPNFTGTGLTPLTAYKFGTSHVVTNGTIAQFLNAGTNVFSVDPVGGISNSTFQTTAAVSTNATRFDVGALLSAYNGVATLLHNTSTNTLITVGSSPFNFTNTASQTIVLYLDANGATTTANLNGQTIFKSLAAGDHTIILKPGAYTTITYAIATPIMTWTEL